MNLPVLSEPKVLVSEIDESINHVHPDGSEFRLVRRADHDTIYISPFTGCSLSCRYCHLTASGDTVMTPLTRHQMLDRVLPLLPDARGRVIFSHMAKGDALANPQVDYMLSRSLLDEAYNMRVPHAKVAISTIFPKDSIGSTPIDEFLFERFGPLQPNLYWSLYSLDSKFREYWMPKAMDPRQVLHRLVHWQKVTGLEVVVHHALIDGSADGIPSNSTSEDARAIRDFLDESDLRYRVNLVLYNPYKIGMGREATSSAYFMHTRYLSMGLGCTEVRAQPRVAFDIAGSCGCFITRESPDM